MQPRIFLAPQPVRLRKCGVSGGRKSAGLNRLVPTISPAVHLPLSVPLRCLTSLELPTVALYVVAFTFTGTFDSHTLPPIVKDLAGIPPLRAPNVRSNSVPEEDSQTSPVLAPHQPEGFFLRCPLGCTNLYRIFATDLRFLPDGTRTNTRFKFLAILRNASQGNADMVGGPSVLIT
jgi:hypothetical protein